MCVCVCVFLSCEREIYLLLFYKWFEAITRVYERIRGVRVLTLVTSSQPEIGKPLTPTFRQGGLQAGEASVGRRGDTYAATPSP